MPPALSSPSSSLSNSTLPLVKEAQLGAVELLIKQYLELIQQLEKDLINQSDLKPD